MVEEGGTVDARPRRHASGAGACWRAASTAVPSTPCGSEREPSRRSGRWTGRPPRRWRRATSSPRGTGPVRPHGRAPPRRPASRQAPASLNHTASAAVWSRSPAATAVLPRLLTTGDDLGPRPPAPDAASSNNLSGRPVSPPSACDRGRRRACRRTPGSRVASGGGPSQTWAAGSMPTRRERRGRATTESPPRTRADGICRGGRSSRRNRGVSGHPSPRVRASRRPGLLGALARRPIKGLVSSTSTAPSTTTDRTSTKLRE